MNKTCARCQKVVYPIEELKCLDKVSKVLFRILNSSTILQFLYSFVLFFFPGFCCWRGELVGAGS